MDPLDSPHLTPRMRILLATPAVYILWAMGWFGVMTFVNNYFSVALDGGDASWTRAMLWFNGGILVWQLLITEISTRIGRLPTLTLCSLIGSLLYLGIPFVSAAFFRDWYMPTMFIAISSVPAAAAGVWMPLVAQTGGNEPGKLLAWVQALNVICCVVVFSAVSAIVAKHGYHTAFLAIGGLCLTATFMFTVLLAPIAKTSGPKPISLLGMKWSDLKGLLSPTVLVILICGFCAEPFSYQTNNQLWPNLVHDVFGWTDNEANMAVTFARLPGMISLFLVAAWVDRLNPMRLYGLMVILTACATVLGGWTHSSAVALAAYAGFHFFQCACWGCDVAAINRAARPEMRDAAICLGYAVITAAALGVNSVQVCLMEMKYSLSDVFLYTGLVALSVGSLLFAASWLNSGRGGSDT